jgi:hypothetical protein
MFKHKKSRQVYAARAAMRARCFRPTAREHVVQIMMEGDALMAVTRRSLVILR